jgi:hypothetical protein
VDSTIAKESKIPDPAKSDAPVKRDPARSSFIFFIMMV